MAVIYAFGDSITYGAWGIKNSGWAAQLRRFLDEKQAKDPDFYALFYNLGISGETTNGLIKRFDPELNARKRDGDEGEAIFIFAFGANDAAYLDETKEFRVSIESFRSNLDSVISKATLVSPKIIVLNILPVTEEIHSKPRYGKIRLNSYMEKYNAVIAEVAKNNNAQFIDVYSVFQKSDLGDYLSDDGLHPNDKGHEVIFEMVKGALEKML